MERLPVSETTLFFDPFADDGEQLFDAAASFDIMLQRYEDGAIEHDYTADRLLNDTKALMLDAQFMDQFDQMTYITAQLHALCQHDQELATALRGEAALFGQAEQHEAHAHDTASHKADAKESKKKKTALRPGWLELLMTYYAKRPQKSR